ncbi:Ankyrin repeat domain-containing protein 33B [Lamellibrachia satsuma]|nr:Ankyrin repeat domain-containing protein 33B [Lamellibrachia satsuma]
MIYAKRCIEHHLLLQTAFSYACANGFMPILELLANVEEVDPNLADNDGNTSLIFAAQAGHDDVVSFLLHQFRGMHIDHCNQHGFTALMKASIQGRTRCAKLLLFAGANPNRHDYGRGLCAEDWARFCGRRACADAIAKYIRSKKYFFTKTFILSKDKWSSEPDLAKTVTPTETSRGGGSWIQRHLSFKKKKSTGNESPSSPGSLQKATRCVSSPELAGTESPPSPNLRAAAVITRRPSCIDGVVPMSLAKCRRGGGVGVRTVCGSVVVEEAPVIEPPKITETDYDLERLGNAGVG